MPKCTKNSKCYVRKCFSSYDKEAGHCSLFKAPTDPILRVKWQSAIGRTDRSLTVRDVVCERHFKPDDILRVWKSGDIVVPYTRCRLKENAVPSVFPRFLRSSMKKKKMYKVESPKMRKTKSQDLTIKKESDKNSALLENRKEPNITLEMQFDNNVTEVVYIEVQPVETPTEHALFQDIFLGNIELDLPVPWTLCPIFNNRSERKDKFILLSEMAVNEGIPSVEKQILIYGDLSTAYFYNSTRVSLDINDTICTVNDIHSVLKAFGKFKVCYGGPRVKEDDQMFESDIAIIDKIKWRHRQCLVLHKTDDACCVNCRELYNIYYQLQKRRNAMPKTYSGKTTQQKR